MNELVSETDMFNYVSQYHPKKCIFKVGSSVASVKVRDINANDNVTITLDKSMAGIQGFGFNHLKDGASHFDIRWQNANPSEKQELSGTITLKKSLQDKFQVGDQLGLSITAHDGVITTRTEIVVFIESPFLSDASTVYLNPLLQVLTVGATFFSLLRGSARKKYSGEFTRPT